MAAVQHNPVLIMRSWLLANAILFLILGLLGVERGMHAKTSALNKHAERIEPGRNEEGITKANWDVQLLSQSKPVEVTSGIYVERIINLSLPDASWIADFYIWFRWNDNNITPGDTFQIIDGELISKQLIKQELTKNPNYQLYRVKAKMTKFFDTTRFPRDDHLLTLNIEDSNDQIYNLKYIPDTHGSAVSSRVKLQGYEIYKSKLVQKYHSYKTDRGEVHLKDKAHETFSQLIYGIWVERPGWGNYIKMFEGLFAAVAVALLSFFIRTTTTNRISLGVGAFFAAVAATYVATKNLPNVGILTLADVITGIAMLTVFLVIWHTIIATRLFEMFNDEIMIRRFDRQGFVLFFCGFILVNISLIISEIIL